MKKLSLHLVHFVESPDQTRLEIKQRVARSFAANIKLNNLVLCSLDVENHFAASPMFTVLAKHPNLRHLQIVLAHNGVTIQASTAATIGNFFRVSSASLQEVTLSGDDWTAEAFGHVASGLRSSNTVTIINIRYFDFD